MIYLFSDNARLFVLENFDFHDGLSIKAGKKLPNDC